MSSIEINGYRFEYHEAGDGVPVVFVHGSASDYRTWQHQQEHFSRDHRAITYSRRYHWPNEAIGADQDYSMWEHVSDLQEFVSRLDAAPAHFIGHSYGAFLCLLLAIRAPKLVRSLVLGEPPVITLFVSSSPKPREIIRLLFSRPALAVALVRFGARGVAPAEAAAKKGEVRKAMHRFGKVLLGDEYYSRLSASRIEQVEANAIKAEFLGSGFAPINEAQIRGIAAPVLLVSGRHSNPLFRYLTDYLETLLPRAERVELEAASHIMHEDAADGYNGFVRKFLDHLRSE